MSEQPFPSNLDPRLNAWRPDLADIELHSVAPLAAKYVTPKPRQCVIGVAPLLAAPQRDAACVSEVRYGEFVDVLEINSQGFAWVKNRYDGYVGYLPDAMQSLSEEISAFSNRVIALHTLVYSAPNAQARVLDRLTLGSYVRLVSRQEKFCELASGGFIAVHHVMPTDASYVKDYVTTAGRFLGIPYAWGGRTTLGLDCSGLVQLALEIAGHESPRDSDQQAAVFGSPLNVPWQSHLWQRGDLVFFDGHVGIMTDGETMIHANAFAMKVTVEPLVTVVARGLPIIAVGKVP